MNAGFPKLLGEINWYLLVKSALSLSYLIKSIILITNLFYDKNSVFLKVSEKVF